jgi:hypothetical protein
LLASSFGLTGIKPFFMERALLLIVLAILLVVRWTNARKRIRKKPLDYRALLSLEIEAVHGSMGLNNQMKINVGQGVSLS